MLFLLKNELITNDQTYIYFEFLYTTRGRVIWEIQLSHVVTEVHQDVTFILKTIQKYIRAKSVTCVKHA